MKCILGLAMAVMMLFGATAFAANTKPTVDKTVTKLTVKKENRKPKKHHRHHRQHRKSGKMLKTAAAKTDTKTQNQ